MRRWHLPLVHLLFIWNLCYSFLFPSWMMNLQSPRRPISQKIHKIARIHQTYRNRWLPLATSWIEEDDGEPKYHELDHVESQTLLGFEADEQVKPANIVKFIQKWAKDYADKGNAFQLQNTENGVTFVFNVDERSFFSFVSVPKSGITYEIQAKVKLDTRRSWLGPMLTSSVQNAAASFMRYIEENFAKAKADGTFEEPLPEILTEETAKEKIASLIPEWNTSEPLTPELLDKHAVSLDDNEELKKAIASCWTELNDTEAEEFEREIEIEKAKLMDNLVDGPDPIEEANEELVFSLPGIDANEENLTDAPATADSTSHPALLSNDTHNPLNSIEKDITIEMNNTSMVQSDEIHIDQDNSSTSTVPVNVSISSLLAASLKERAKNQTTTKASTDTPKEDSTPLPLPTPTKNPPSPRQRASFSQPPPSSITEAIDDIELPPPNTPPGQSYESLICMFDQCQRQDFYKIEKFLIDYLNKYQSNQVRDYEFMVGTLQSHEMEKIGAPYLLLERHPDTGMVNLTKHPEFIERIMAVEFLYTHNNLRDKEFYQFFIFYYYFPESNEVRIYFKRKVDFIKFSMSLNLHECIMKFQNEFFNEMNTLSKAFNVFGMTEQDEAEQELIRKAHRDAQTGGFIDYDSKLAAPSTVKEILEEQEALKEKTEFFEINTNPLSNKFDSIGDRERAMEALTKVLAEEIKVLQQNPDLVNSLAAFPAERIKPQGQSTTEAAESAADVSATSVPISSEQSIREGQTVSNNSLVESKSIVNNTEPSPSNSPEPLAFTEDPHGKVLPPSSSSSSSLGNLPEKLFSQRQSKLKERANPVNKPVDPQIRDAAVAELNKIIKQSRQKGLAQSLDTIRKDIRETKEKLILNKKLFYEQYSANDTSDEDEQYRQLFQLGQQISQKNFQTIVNRNLPMDQQQEEEENEDKKDHHLPSLDIPDHNKLEGGAATTPRVKSKVELLTQSGKLLEKNLQQKKQTISSLLHQQREFDDSREEMEEFLQKELSMNNNKPTISIDFHSLHDDDLKELYSNYDEKSLAEEAGDGQGSTSKTYEELEASLTPEDIAKGQYTMEQLEASTIQFAPRLKMNQSTLDRLPINYTHPLFPLVTEAEPANSTLSNETTTTTTTSKMNPTITYPTSVTSSSATEILRQRQIDNIHANVKDIEERNLLLESSDPDTIDMTKHPVLDCTANDTKYYDFSLFFNYHANELEDPTIHPHSIIDSSRIFNKKKYFLNSMLFLLSELENTTPDMYDHVLKGYQDILLNEYIISGFQFFFQQERSLKRRRIFPKIIAKSVELHKELVSLMEYETAKHFQTIKEICDLSLKYQQNPSKQSKATTFQESKYFEFEFFNHLDLLKYKFDIPFFKFLDYLITSFEDYYFNHPTNFYSFIPMKAEDLPEEIRAGDKMMKLQYLLNQYQVFYYEQDEESWKRQFLEKIKHLEESTGIHFTSEEIDQKMKENWKLREKEENVREELRWYLILKIIHQGVFQELFSRFADLIDMILFVIRCDEDVDFHQILFQEMIASIPILDLKYLQILCRNLISNILYHPNPSKELKKLILSYPTIIRQMLILEQDLFIYLNDQIIHEKLTNYIKEYEKETGKSIFFRFRNPERQMESDILEEIQKNQWKTSFDSIKDIYFMKFGNRTIDRDGIFRPIEKNMTMKEYSEKMNEEEKTFSQFTAEDYALRYSLAPQDLARWKFAMKSKQSLGNLDTAMDNLLEDQSKQEEQMRRARYQYIGVDAKDDDSDGEGGGGSGWLTDEEREEINERRAKLSLEEQYRQEGFDLDRLDPDIQAEIAREREALGFFAKQFEETDQTTATATVSSEQESSSSSSSSSNSGGSVEEVADAPSSPPERDGEEVESSSQQQPE